MIKPEILAPCGSYDILVAAVKAGADACYIGGNKFGARAYAKNLDTDSIVRAIDYAHLYGTRLYLTVNTLFKQKEINELYDYLLPYYLGGIDAVIVQDLGVFSMIRKLFPDLAIHCSTQMNITSIHAAKKMYELGATRIVTAREMEIDEIKYIKEQIPELEIESFVHGAMCYSYSGQCLMSSLAGGRSGNRGRCAQPCRKCYDGKYTLSMKDMCTLENLPLIMMSGIDSLKIEGRMKNEYYVASAVDAYKRIRDAYFDKSFDILDASEYQDILANIFNRGGFSGGYYFTHNGKNMISINRPNNQGVCVGTLMNALGGKVEIKLKEQLYKKDVLEVKLNDDTIIELTSNVDANAGKIVSLNAPKTKLIVKNQEIYRTRCNHILQDIENKILNNGKKIAINGEFKATIGKPFTFTVWKDDKSITVTEGIVEISEKQRTSNEIIYEKINQIGDTDFCFEHLQIDVDQNAFVPMGLVKKLRRLALEQLAECIVKSYHRNILDVTYDKEQLMHNYLSNDKNETIASNYEDIFYKKSKEVFYHAHVTSFEQLQCIMTKPAIHRVYCSKNLLLKLDNNIVNKDLYLELPYVIRNEFNFDEYVSNLDEYNIKGVYLRNIDGLFALLDSNMMNKEYFQVMCGFSLYCYNKEAIYFIRSFFPSNWLIEFETPKELSLAELDDLNISYELPIYGYDQVMLTAQCVQKTIKKCTKGNEWNKITDDQGNSFYSRCKCDECLNIIYNGKPISLFSKLNEIGDKLSISSYVFTFTKESETEVAEILDKMNYNKSYTTGHLFRGIE